VYIVCIRGRYSFSLVCTFNKAIKNFKVKVDVRKRALRLREKNENNFVSLITVCVHSLLLYGNSPQ
jgi:hypothetical protein